MGVNHDPAEFGKMAACAGRLAGRRYPRVEEKIAPEINQGLIFDRTRRRTPIVALYGGEIQLCTEPLGLRPFGRWKGGQTARCKHAQSCDGCYGPHLITSFAAGHPPSACLVLIIIHCPDVGPDCLYFVDRGGSAADAPNPFVHGRPTTKKSGQMRRSFCILGGMAQHPVSITFIRAWEPMISAPR